MMLKKYKYQISVFTIWLFNIFGIIGVSSSYSDWFLERTPLNLAIYFVLILWNLDSLKKKYFVAISIPIVIGYFVEFLGANYSLIFGEYSYGNNLGIKLYGVPLIICLNWCVLTVTCADISSFFSKNTFICSAVAAIIMTSLDVIIEISAPRFDFWEFENETVPIQNYIGWFIISLVIHLIFKQFEVKSDEKLSIHILSAIVIFFISFLIL